VIDSRMPLYCVKPSDDGWYRWIEWVPAAPGYSLPLIPFGGACSWHGYDHAIEVATLGRLANA
jgi:hypothetical protein